MVKSKPSMTGSSRLEPFGDFDYRHLGDSGRYSIGQERVQELKGQGLNGSSALQNYIDENGLYGKPTVMGDAEFDAYAKKNKLKVIFRGMPDGEWLTGEEKHANFIYDDKYYVGNGIFGDGMYFGSERTAKMYAVTGYFEGEGAVMKAALKPGAKVVKYEAIQSEFAESYPLYKYSENMLSVYARSRGYDAVTTSDGYTNVINRDALVVSSNVRRIELHEYVD